MKKIYLLLLPCLLTLSALSQKREKPEEYPFLAKEILYLSDSTGIGSLEYADIKKAGILFTNDKAMIIKEVNIPGKVIALATRKGNVLVFYVNEWRTEVTKEIHVVLVDAAKRSIITDNVIFKNPGDNQLDCRVGRDVFGEFGYLLIRTTGLTGDPGKKMSLKEAMNWNKTNSIQVVMLSDNLEPTLHTLSSVAANGHFISTLADKKGTVTILAHANGLIAAEKYGRDGQLIKKLTQPMEQYQGDDHILSYPTVAVCGYDPGNDDRLAISIRHRDERNRNNLLSVFSFDFGGGESFTSGTKTLDDDFTKEITHDPQMQHPKRFKRLNWLIPATLDFVGDRIVICDDAQYVSTGNSATVYSSEGGIVSIYDDQLHLQHRAFMYRMYDTFIDLGRGFSSGVRDGKVMLLANEITGIAKYGLFAYIIDPEKGTLEKKETDQGLVMREYPADLRSVFWFRKDWVISRGAGSYFFGKHVDCYINPVPYLP